MNRIHKKDFTKQRVVLFSILALLLLFVAIFAPLLVPYDPYAQDLSQALRAPSKEHLMGTDQHGRDLFSRVLMGGQTTIVSTLVLVFLIAVIGTVLGMISGYRGGLLDTLIMRSSDVFLAFPGMVFAIAVASVMAGGIWNAVIALALISWPKYARLARSQVLSIKETPYFLAARLAGNHIVQMIWRHILPNIAGPIIVTAMLDIGTMMMEIAGLSFLGLGAVAPAAEWGSMMSQGRSLLQLYPWVVLSPGIAIFITVVVFNLFGDALRDLLDPKTV